MANNLNQEQRKWILKQYWKCKNAEQVRTLWQEAFNTPPPSRQAIYRIRNKFESSGSVINLPKSGRPKTSMTEENEIRVALTFVNSPRKSTRCASMELSIPRTSLRRLMLKLKPYHPHLIHGLLEDDPDRRLQFCEMVRDQITKEQPDFLDKIIWSNEACFKLSGHVNRHNCVYWDDENPHFTIMSQLNQPGVTVWGALSSEGVVGPVFFDGTVDGANYLKMLRDVVVPQLRTRANFTELFFQQDGAPPHYALAVRDYLDQTFPQRWFGRRGSIEWPPRSPDLTPMDFFFWGIVKKRVYERNPHTVDELKEYISEVFIEIDADLHLCRAVCQSVLERFEECCNVEGGHFERLRD